MSVDVARPLVLPPPVANGDANGHDDAMNGVTEHMAETSLATPAASKYATGLIYPPPDIRSIIDRTATFVARSANPPQFEEKIREKHRTDPKFSFVNSSDPYNAYYRHVIDKIQEGEEVGGGSSMTMDESGLQIEETLANDVKESGIPKEPPTQEFVVEKPPISALDLDILKLTALFTARQGHGFLASLSHREGRNYQFDFLRPNHSLFGYFNRMVDQYTRVLLPPQESLEALRELKSEGAKWKTLAAARERAEWESYRREKEKQRDDNAEAEKKAFAEIDWHDYAIVQTIEFTSADATSELPAPMSIAEVENMTLAQKKMASMIMENAAPEVEAFKASQAHEQAMARAGHDVEMEVESENEEEANAKKEAKRREDEELARAKALQAKSLEHGGPMKIRENYVPKTLAGKNAAKVATTTCQICGQSIPVNELEEHMRIELLDPRWKTQRDALESRRAAASEQQLGANVVSSLKQLARVFGDDQSDEAARKRLEAEAEAKRKEREKVAWDGHTASKANVVDKFQTNVNFDEQIASIWKAKGLGGADPSTTGPSIGPSVGPSGGPIAAPSAQIPPPSLPPNPVTAPQYANATVSSGPQPASVYPAGYQAGGVGMYPPHPSLPPVPSFPMGGGGAAGYPVGSGGVGVGTPMGGMHPSRLAALAGGGGATPPMAGMTRSADEMMDGGMAGMDGNGGEPVAKRIKIDKLPEGQYYPEQHWVQTHPLPVSLSIRLPSQETTEVQLKPEWNLNGSVVTIPDLPVTLLVSTLRDRILSAINSTLAASRVRLNYGNKVLTNSMSLAMYNLDDGDEIVLHVREGKKK